MHDSGLSRADLRFFERQSRVVSRASDAKLVLRLRAESARIRISSHRRLEIRDKWGCESIFDGENVG